MGAIIGTAILGLALDASGSALTAQQRALWCFAGAFALSAAAALKLRAPR
jgi:hypothetical protein